MLGEHIGVTAVNERAHRVDTLSFFARYLYRRQTGNAQTTYIASMSSNEAWITYGHGRVFNQYGNLDTDNDYLPPAWPIPPTMSQIARFAQNNIPFNQQNPKNYYASDWVLTRIHFPDAPSVRRASRCLYG